MPIRNRLSSVEFLNRVDAAGGHASRKAAQRLLRLGDEIGAQRVGRHAAMSIRLAGPLGGVHDWITLFVVSTAGTLYINWLERWSWIGLPESVANQFRRSLITALGESVEQIPSSHKNGVPLTEVIQHWDEFERAVRSAATTITAFVTNASHAGGMRPRDGGSESAVEGQLTELRVIRRGRSQKLRDEALKRSSGVCAACSTDFGALLGGRGWSVLQVHHVEQLSSRDEPAVTTVDDLAVVCANCHMLIHADRNSALGVDAIKALWRNHRDPMRRKPIAPVA